MSTFWLVCIIIWSVAFLGVLIYFGLNLFFYRLSLSKNSITRKILQYHIKNNYDLYAIDLDWFEKHKVTMLSRKASDGTLLYGNFYERKGNKLAVICHGYGADFREMCIYAKYFYNRGFSVLLPEFRGHGRSEGKVIGMGWLDRMDVKGWIEYMVERNPDYKIALFGLSMGASTVCMTVGEELPKNVKCAISDCGYANAYEQFEDIVKKIKVVSSKMVMKMYNNFLQRAFYINLKNYDAVKQLKKAKIPMLFIHGNKDEFVPFENLQKLYDAHPSEKHKYIYVCDGAKHALSYQTNKREYEKRLGEFLEKEYYEK